MAFKDRIRRAVSRKESVVSASSSGPSSSPSGSHTSSGVTTPALSPTPSTVQLPELAPSSTIQSTKTLTLTKTNSSKFSLTRFRSQKDDYARYAPKNYKFTIAQPGHVAILNAWDMKFGSVRESFSSESAGICPHTLSRE